MLQLYENIRNRRIELGMSQQELAELMGYTSRSTIAKIECGKNDIPQSKISAFAKALRTTSSALMGWNESAIANNILPLPQTRRIPLLGTIACGEPITAVENVDQYIEADVDIHCDFALRCKGDSMIEARILDGDVVYVRQQPTVENGEIAAVLIGDEATLKRIYVSDTALTLMPANAAYQPTVFVGEDMNNVRILGKAVAFTSTVK